MKNKILTSILSAAVLLSGCSASRPENLPEDNPCNHIDIYTIMETENGYYTNAHGEPDFWNSISLKFIEKGTGKRVYLCARPECMHDGSEMCTATYKHLESLGSVLYNGAIYTLATENINGAVSCSIYRSALDGSSITRVGSVVSVNNVKDENYSCSGTDFIIHKGYAYVSYHLSFGGTMFGFAGSGLARMNLADGSSEILYSGENYYSEVPCELQGSGDYVYYSIWGGRSESGVYAYNIEDGATEKLDFINTNCGYVAGERVFVTYSYQFMEDYDYTFKPHEICTVNKETGKVTNLVHIEEPAQHCEYVLPYKDMIIVTLDSGVYVYSENGELIAAAEYLSPENYHKSSSLNALCGTAIVGDKLYLYDVGNFYSCPIDDILAGGGSWKHEYDVYA